MNWWVIACRCKDDVGFWLFTNYGMGSGIYKTRDEARYALKWIKKEYPNFIFKIVKTTVDLNN